MGAPFGNGSQWITAWRIGGSRNALGPFVVTRSSPRAIRTPSDRCASICGQSIRPQRGEASRVRASSRRDSSRRSARLNTVSHWSRLIKGVDGRRARLHAGSGRTGRARYLGAAGTDDEW